MTLSNLLEFATLKFIIMITLFNWSLIFAGDSDVRQYAWSDRFIIRIQLINLSFVFCQLNFQVAAIMSCPLPLPLPLLPPALHADYPPIHIGVKVSLFICCTIFKLFFFYLYQFSRARRLYSRLHPTCQICSTQHWIF